ncbi:MAG: hypothetical protein IJ697_04400 [Synergistaceae bacterium]|nr:hypothetical protein [Synergistaceae bacterium]
MRKPVNIQAIKFSMKHSIAISIVQSVLSSILIAGYGLLRSGELGVKTSLFILPAVTAVIGAAAAKKHSKLAAYIMLISAVITLIIRLTADPSMFISIICLLYAVASADFFRKFTIEAPDAEIEDLLEGSELMNKQDQWLKSLDAFIKRYGLIAYYGYQALVMPCIFLSLAWLFAPEGLIYGHSREFWALSAAWGLAAVCGFFAEMFRRRES